MTAPGLYLLDVEGTTSPVSLVSEMLFPYARRHLEGFLREHWEKPEVRADLALLMEENRAESDPACPRIDADLQTAKKAAVSSEFEGEHTSGAKARVDGTGSMPGINPRHTLRQSVSDVGLSCPALGESIAYLWWLMDRDRKSTALKSIQGKIWRSGYLAGELVGTVFPDVPGAFERWSKAAKVAIYSSGSVEAQQLIFRYSSAGDLTPFISAYFDTRTGAKTSVESYQAIARACGVEPGEILFVSDLLRELDPAREARCRTRLSVREGNQPVPDWHGHVAVRSLSEIS